MKQLSIIIIHYKTIEETFNCITSIFRETKTIDFEIIVVDNNSNDTSKARILNAFPTINWIENELNEGFARANLKGVNHASGEYILLLNSDTIIIENAIEKSLIKLQQLNAEIGMLGCKLINEDGTNQQSVYYNTSGFKNQIENNLLYSTVIKWCKLKQHQPTEIKALMGAFLLFNKSLVEQCGFMDSDFFLYAEEFEWMDRIRSKGYKLYYYTETKIIHLGEKSSSKLLNVKQRTLSAGLLFLKTHGRIGFLWFLIIDLINQVIAILYGLLNRVKLSDQLKHARIFISLLPYFLKLFLKFNSKTKKVNFLVKLNDFK